MLTFQQFLEKFNGQQNVGNTTKNKGECVGLAAIWVDNLGLDHIWGNAKDLINNYNPNQFEFILNTPDAVPKTGDIICWNFKMGGGFGHTAISTGTGNITTFEVFEQNNPTESTGNNCHLRTYSNYNNVIGWLHPKAPPIADTTNYKKLYEEKVKLETFLRGEIQKKDETINNLNNQISDLEKEKNRLAEELKQCLLVTKEHEGCQAKILKATNLKNQAEQDLAKAKGDWQIKEVAYNKQISLLTTKYQATKSSIKKLLINYIFGKV